MALAVATLAAPHAGWSAVRTARPLSATSVGQVVPFARDHPAETWFPMNPLIGAKLERHPTHFAPALYERALVGMPISDAQFNRHLPERMVRLCWPIGTDLSDPVVTWVHARVAVTPVRVTGLPGWPCFTVQNVVAPDSVRNAQHLAPVTGAGR